MVFQFIRGVGWVGASENPTKAHDTKNNNRIVDVVEGVDADAVALL